MELVLLILVVLSQFQFDPDILQKLLIDLDGAGQQVGLLLLSYLTVLTRIALNQHYEKQYQENRTELSKS